jgi:polyisoprenoid-binding protein YceI
MIKMKRSVLFLAIALLSVAALAQQKTTTSAIISFDATTAIDNLPKAENKTAVAAIDLAKNTVEFEATIKNFDFANPKIQEHFNAAGWMNSDQFPAATFSGIVTTPAASDFKKNGTYHVTVQGDLTIKGKTQKITLPASIIVDGNTVKASASFTLKLADFGVDGPAVSAGKVSREPKITVYAELN